MLTLAIEASNPSLRVSPPRCAPAVALGTPDSLLAVEPIHPASRHDDDLVAAIDRLFRRAGITKTQVGRVAVSVGPGGYTSLRMACATAQMLGLAWGVPCVRVPSAAVVLRSLRVELSGAGPVGIALSGKADQAHLSVFPDPERPIPESAGLVDAEGLIARDLRVLVADEHLPPSLRNAALQQGLNVIATSIDVGALLAASRHFRDESPSMCVPDYGREPEAVTKWRTLHGDAAPRAGSSPPHDAQ